MSSSQYRDTLHTTFTRGGITGHGEGAPIVRYHEDAASAQKAVESVRDLLLSADPHAVRQDHGRGLQARARRVGGQGRDRYRADGLGGPEAGHSALFVFRTRPQGRAAHHVFHRHRHAGDHQAEDAGSRRLPGAQSESRAGHRRADHRGRPHVSPRSRCGWTPTKAGRTRKRRSARSTGWKRWASSSSSSRMPAEMLEETRWVRSQGPHPGHRRRSLPARRRHSEAQGMLRRRQREAG